jgi:hypothetical protein
MKQTFINLAEIMEADYLDSNLDFTEFSVIGRDVCLDGSLFSCFEILPLVQGRYILYPD